MHVFDERSGEIRCYDREEITFISQRQVKEILSEGVTFKLNL